MTASAPPGEALAIWLMALGVTLGYASLQYAFGALLVDVQAATGWSKAALAGGLTLALVTAAGFALKAGRLVDRGFGAELLCGGAVLGGVALLIISGAGSLWQWYAGWALAGPAMTAQLYETCFAFLTRRLGKEARPAIIRITLVAGLASTLAFPLGAFIAAHGGWRLGFVAFAGLELLVAAPVLYLAGWLLRRQERRGQPGGQPARDGILRWAMRTRAFWLLSLTFALSSANHTMLVAFFIPLFTGLGASGSLAVAAAATVGPFQVIGRLGLLLAGARAEVVATTRTVLAVLASASLVLLAAGLDIRLIFVFAVMQGASIGVMSILRPLLTAEIMGHAGFGAISGAAAIGPLLANALAPTLGAAVFMASGAGGLALTGCAMAALALGMVLVLRRPAGLSEG